MLSFGTAKGVSSGWSCPANILIKVVLPNKALEATRLRRITYQFRFDPAILQSLNH